MNQGTRYYSYETFIYFTNDYVFAAVRFGRVPKKEKAKIMEQMQKVNTQSQVCMIQLFWAVSSLNKGESNILLMIVTFLLRECFIETVRDSFESEITFTFTFCQFE